MYDSPLLTEMVEILREQTETALERMAHDAGDYMRDVVKRNTPIEGFIKQVAFRDQNGRYVYTSATHLRDNIDLKPVRVVVDERGNRVYETGAETNVSYAPYVENGTGLWGPKRAKYIIRPKKPYGFLSWITQHGFTRKDGTFVAPGTRVFAKKVEHPGSPGAHMFAIGAAMTEAEFAERIARPALEDWEIQAELEIGRL